MTRILFIGDVMGKPGRELIRRGLDAIIAHHRIDIVIVNGENSAAGFGITPDIADDFLSHGVSVITGGNHSWDKKEILPYIAGQQLLLRPANFPEGAPGRGFVTAKAKNGVVVGVINVMGRVFMQAIDDPFTVVQKAIEALASKAAIIFVDFHAEATSEKVAMGWHLDGRVAAVVGTHTHVPTADARVLPKGTAYVTDVGMTGPHDSVIGVERRAVLQRFLNGMPQRFETATENPRLNSVIVTADETTGLATNIERLDLSQDEIEALLAQPVARS